MKNRRRILALLLCFACCATLTSCTTQRDPLSNEAVQRDPRGVLLELLRVYGVAAVQVALAPELEERAPELFRLVDKNGDRVLDESELLSIDPTSPVFALVVASTVHRLIESRE